MRLAVVLDATRIAANYTLRDEPALFQSLVQILTEYVLLFSTEDDPYCPDRLEYHFRNLHPNDRELITNLDLDVDLYLEILQVLHRFLYHDIYGVTTTLKAQRYRCRSVRIVYMDDRLVVVLLNVVKRDRPVKPTKREKTPRETFLPPITEPRYIPSTAPPLGLFDADNDELPF